MDVITRCPLCNRTKALRVNQDAYFAWLRGASAQDVFPKMSADDRERLISGTCPDCWNNMFGEEDE